MLRIDDKTLWVGEKKFLFSRPVRSAFYWNDIVILDLKLVGTADGINNIYGIKEELICWQIEDARRYQTEKPSTSHYHMTDYTAVKIYDEDENLLIATTSNGFRFLVNPENGAIVGQGTWVK